MSERVPPEICTEILVRLPPPYDDSSSKPWKFVVQSSHTPKQTAEFDIPFYGNDNVNAVDYVNGFLWLYKDFKNYHCEFKDVILWNPSTRKSLRIPEPPAYYLGYCTTIGFGYDPVSDDYKAVSIFHKDLDSEFSAHPDSLVEVYSVKTRSWRSIGVNAIDSNWYLGQFVHISGAIHWVAFYDYADGGGGIYRFIHLVSFNLGTELFSYTMLPAFEDDNEPYWGRVRLPVLFEGSLAVFYVSFSHIRVWVMRENGWSKEWTIPLPSQLGHYLFDVGGFIKDVIFSKKSNELLITASVGGLVSYNIHTQEIKVSDRSATYMGDFVESLFWREVLPPRVEE